MINQAELRFTGSAIWQAPSTHTPIQIFIFGNMLDKYRQ